MKRILIGTLAYVLVSFASQATSHFAINAEHYASIPFMRTEPIMILGILTMIIQGGVLSYLYGFFSRENTGIGNGLLFGLLIALFFVSYPALVEPSKYIVPSVGAWMAVEGLVGLVQFSLFGTALGWIFSRVQ